MLVAVAYSLLIHYLLYGTTTIATTCNYYIKIYIYICIIVYLYEFYTYTPPNIWPSLAPQRVMCAHEVWPHVERWSRKGFQQSQKVGGPKGRKTSSSKHHLWRVHCYTTTGGVDNFKEWDGYYSMPIYLVIWFCVGFARFYGYWFSVPIRRWVMLSKSYPFGHGMNCGSQRIIWGNTKNE